MQDHLRNVYASAVRRPAEAAQHLAAKVKLYSLTFLIQLA
jgi:hypothetical protein